MDDGVSFVVKQVHCSGIRKPSGWKENPCLGMFAGLPYWLPFCLPLFHVAWNMDTRVDKK